ncbi:HAD family hydrolase [Lederbergia graminis]|uniref:HAD family hydrolase n=1 Tax=Lederbergia graminis TaxID=735518 RepID=A0ABW0LHY5_9BACI
MIKTVLFDVDGVLLSEERYFDSSALTVWEILNSGKYIGLAPNKNKVEYSDEEIAEIRSNVFVDDQVLKLLKSAGLNANWDMIYVTVCNQLIHLLEQVKGTEKANIEKWVTNPIDRKVLQEIGEVLATKNVQLDFLGLLDNFADAEKTKDGLFTHIDKLVKEKLDVSGSQFAQSGALWDTCEHICQEWYVGDDNVLESTGRPSVQTGKQGFLSQEKVLAPAEEIARMFAELKDAGIMIGIGTGRPELETIEPFKHLNWLQYFNVNNIVTADDVLAAEREYPNLQLSKPNPYTYVMALSSKQKTALECIETQLPLENGEEVLIVGDSLADLLAARKMGSTFAAVLTGLSGKNARAEFENYNVKYIFDNVMDVRDFVLASVK